MKSTLFLKGKIWMEKARTNYFLSNDTFQVFCEAVVRLLHNVVCKDKDKVFDKVLVASLVINSSLSCDSDVTSTLHPWGNLTSRSAYDHLFSCCDCKRTRELANRSINLFVKGLLVEEDETVAEGIKITWTVCVFCDSWDLLVYAVVNRNSANYLLTIFTHL